MEIFLVIYLVGILLTTVLLYIDWDEYDNEGQTISDFCNYCRCEYTIPLLIVMFCPVINLIGLIMFIFHCIFQYIKNIRIK